MSDALALLAALAPGLALAWPQRRLAGAAPLALAVPLWGVLATGLWLAALQLLGVHWSPPLLLVPALGAALAVAAMAVRPGRRKRRAKAAPRERTWRQLAIAGSLASALLVLVTPAFGWDFRYIWGLKARVFAGAGGSDTAWLAWPGHAFAHPGYPPLWPDLLAFSATLGSDVTRAAALWQAVFLVALAVACWELARGAPPWARALAAVAGAWAPVLVRPVFSGYAEALLAFLTAAALGALGRIRSGEASATMTTIAAAAALGLAKNEGIVLAGAVVLAAILAGRGQWRLLPAAALLPALGWQLFLMVNRIPGEGLVASPSLLANRVLQLPSALGRAMISPVVVVEFVVWGLALLAMRGEGPGSIRLVLAIWAAAVLATYLAGSADMSWRMANSLDRVLGAPLPAVVALALGASFRLEAPPNETAAAGRRGPAAAGVPTPRARRTVA